MLNQRLYEVFEQKARRVTVAQFCLGLGYTAVSTSDGGIGIAYSYFHTKNTCMMHHNYQNPEGRPALELVEKIRSDAPLQRSMALAAINALNFETARDLPETPGNEILLDNLGIKTGTRVAMVGAFKPVISLIEQRGGNLAIHDMDKQIGDRNTFYDKLDKWAEVLILTSTSLLNNTAETILSRINSKARTAMLGPSTPLVGEVFSDLPVNFLAGTVPVDREAIFRSVRHGTGTPIIQKFGRKVMIGLD